MKNESLLTTDEHELLRRAQDEALAGMTFDVEAGLADLRERARRPAAPARQQARWRERLRLRVGTTAGLAALFAAVTGGGFGVVAMQARTESPQVRMPDAPAQPVTPAVPPTGSAHPSARSHGPIGDRSATPTLRDHDPDQTLGGTPAATGTTAAPPVAGPIVGDPPVPAPTTSPTDAPPPAAALPAATSPAAAGSAAPGTAAAGSTAAGTAAAGPAAEPFAVHYAAMSLTLPVDDEQPQAIDLDEPRTTAGGDGAVAISAVPDTGDLLLEPADDVQAATVDAAGVTPDECAAAIRDDPAGDTPLKLRDDRTYCLLTPGEKVDGDTLVQLTVDEKDDEADEVVVHLSAWNVGA
ncbi:hypothetical protein AB0F72_35860 [Actinoplanes sp. NPDC023936]|uniref:hypothetical protein n=1 Tax=Actinoplanes sp. NPDC023936 TaxID=3154910 RepID=UPI00340E62CD